MSSRYERAGAIDAHIIGKGFHLTSMTQLSRFFFSLATHPRIAAFRVNGSHLFEGSVPPFGNILRDGMRGLVL
jgi:hypothetical protein